MFTCCFYIKYTFSNLLFIIHSMPCFHGFSAWTFLLLNRMVITLSSCSFKYLFCTTRTGLWATLSWKLALMVYVNYSSTSILMKTTLSPINKEKKAVIKWAWCVVPYKTKKIIYYHVFFLLLFSSKANQHVFSKAILELR